jgi:hypothetical protein
MHCSNEGPQLNATCHIAPVVDLDIELDFVGTEPDSVGIDLDILDQVDSFVVDSQAETQDADPVEQGNILQVVWAHS